MNVYKISEGHVTEIWSDNEIYKFSERCDWQNEALIIADSEETALELAGGYDDGLLGVDDKFWPNCYGRLITCIEQTNTNMRLLKK